MHWIDRILGKEGVDSFNLKADVFPVKEGLDKMKHDTFDDFSTGGRVSMFAVA